MNNNDFILFFILIIDLTKLLFCGFRFAVAENCFLSLPNLGALCLLLSYIRFSSQCLSSSFHVRERDRALSF